MTRLSAGVLAWRHAAGRLEVLLVHPGGPFWRKRDIGAWQIPKGEVEDGETEEAAARREAGEELGVGIPHALRPLGRIRQKGGKEVATFAVELEFDPADLRSNVFEIEWPPRSGRPAIFPEVDEARWMAVGDAARMMLPSQLPLLDRLVATVGEPGAEVPR